MISTQIPRSIASVQRSPDDLRLALGQDRLADLVRDAVPNPDQCTHLAESSERILALLTYSYAAGVYDSSEIPLALRQNDLSPPLSGDVSLDGNALRQFRRTNREELRNCLSQVLRRARDTAPAGLLKASTQAMSLENDDGCEREAEERINRAIRADTFATDD